MRCGLSQRSQGGVKIPTGGNCVLAHSPRALAGLCGKDSRPGWIPGPTVKVRMKENGVSAWLFARRCGYPVRPIFYK